MFLTPKVAVEWLGLVLTRKVPGLNLGLEIGNPNRDF
jgi:hypothetical protein